MSFIRRYPFMSFFLIAFGWSWLNDYVGYYLVDQKPGLFSLTLTRTWGPLIAVLIVINAQGQSIQSWWKRVTYYRVAMKWYVAALALPFVLGETRSLIHWSAGAELQFQGYSPLLVVLNFVVVLFLGGALEELGWRDYVQRYVQNTYSVILVAIGVGVVWTLWHAPLFYLYDLPSYTANQFIPYLVTVVGLSLIFTWVYNGSGGVVLLPMLAHATANLPSFTTTSGNVSEAVTSIASILHPTSFVVVGLILLVIQNRFRPRTFT